MAAGVVLQVHRGTVTFNVSGPDNLTYALIQLVVEAAVVREAFKVRQVSSSKVTKLLLRSPPTAGHLDYLWGRTAVEAVRQCLLIHQIYPE